ncbi:MAG: hypothetical protein JW751_04600 [Polyangiaceae bacterium]|nr:hypothetical protein [Polyangiaceae bacterium]
MRRFPVGWLILSWGLVIAVGCSKESEGGDGDDGGAGPSSAGGAATSSGGARTGGRGTGGVGTTGGRASGGSTGSEAGNGGEATGGVAPDGGRPSGGRTTGGRGSGGTNSGGTAGGEGGGPSGGQASGGRGSGGRNTGGTAASGAAGESNGGEVSGGASTGGANTGGISAGGAGTGICGAAEGQLFDASHPWNQRIDTAQLDAESATIIAYLQANHTSGQRFRIDGPSDETNNVYGIVVQYADASTLREAFTRTDDFYSPDCDPAPIPVPSGGFIEGETGYECESDGDCHLVVVDPVGCRLYEMWRANRTSSEFFGGCQAVWDLTEPYQPTLRGECCTSADAAGLPIAAHMFDADEIYAGEIRHAIRFILPNSLMRDRIYVRPATHSTPATSGPDSAPPYGARMRLKASFDPSGLKPAARVVAEALKNYGMILSDGGNLTFTAANDRLTTHKWAEVDLMPGDLTSLEWTDFEVVELGTRYSFDDCDCDRTPIAE